MSEIGQAKMGQRIDGEDGGNAKKLPIHVLIAIPFIVCVYGVYGV